VKLALCKIAPDLPAVPKLVNSCSYPELLCDIVADWPIQTVRLTKLIDAAGGTIDAPADPWE
jgi:hypothetical protein